METVQTGKLSWFDFPTKDETKSMPFYKSVLDWNFIPMGPGYWMIQVGKEMIGGLRKESVIESQSANAFVPYFTVPSTREGRTLVEKNGGKLVGETIAINGGEDGYFQNFTDLDGNLIALWSKKP